MNRRNLSSFFTAALITAFSSLFASATSLAALDTKPSILETTPMHFDPNYVKRNKVKKITMLVMNKKDDFPIEDKGLTEGYEFDTLGNVIRYWKTSILSVDVVEKKMPAIYRKGKRISPPYTIDTYKYTYDTAFTWFKYDNLNRLINKRIHVGDFFFSWYFDYNTNGFLSKQTYCKESNKNPSKHNFDLGVQTILSSESFDYLFQTTNQLKKICLNDDGKEYKSAIINFKRDFIEESYTYVVGYARNYNYYIFDEKGRTKEISFYSNSNGDNTLKKYYEYDENEELKMEKIYSNEEPVHTYSYYYDSKTKLLTSRLDRSIAKKNIEIVKFVYDFY
jgi:hypothetical protein